MIKAKKDDEKLRIIIIFAHLFAAGLTSRPLRYTYCSEYTHSK